MCDRMQMYNIPTELPPLVSEASANLITMAIYKAIIKTSENNEWHWGTRLLYFSINIIKATKQSAGYVDQMRVFWHGYGTGLNWLWHDTVTKIPILQKMRVT
jgi:hypothetical protein